MSWARLDDGFYRNPKQLKMTDGAFRLYVCALSYCAEAPEPTGYLTHEQADALRRMFRQPLSVIPQLLALNAWERADGGYLIHDYEDYLDRGSKERTRQYRARRRQGNVTVDVTGPSPVTTPSPFPPGPPLSTPPPGPEPEDAPPYPPRGDVRSENRREGPPLGARAVELLQGFGELMGRTHSATEALKAEEFCAELAYLTPAEMLDRMRAHLAWCSANRAHRPNSLAGFWSTLRSENEHRRDNGARPLDAGPGIFAGLP